LFFKISGPAAAIEVIFKEKLNLLTFSGVISIPVAFVEFHLLESGLDDGPT